ncbi:MAG TPA: rRNA maturation RNase YbeY [Ignavibacteria bacterium]|nr:rRNA maturation RNase YbeY [Ignavibacteria bacterium]
MKNLFVENNLKYRINKKTVHSIISKLKKEFQFKVLFLEINFVDSKQISDINESYLSHKGSTDIITFNYSKDTFNLDGECYICVPDAIENAKKYKISVQNELLRLIIHGVLHLLGYDDTKEPEKKKMKKEENRLVNLFFNNDLRIIRE